MPPTAGVEGGQDYRPNGWALRLCGFLDEAIVKAALPSVLQRQGCGVVWYGRPSECVAVYRGRRPPSNLQIAWVGLTLCILPTCLKPPK